MSDQVKVYRFIKGTVSIDGKVLEKARAFGITRPRSEAVVIVLQWRTDRLSLLNNPSIIDTPQEKLSLSDCRFISSQYNCQEDWINNHNASFAAANKNDWLKLCSKHFNDNPVSRLTLEDCKTHAAKYTTRTKWVEAHYQSFNIARKNSWLGLCNLAPKKAHYTKKELIKLGGRYYSQKDWMGKDNHSYRHARKMGCLKQVKFSKKPEITFQFSECKEIAEGFDNRLEWFRGHGRSYHYAKKMGWLTELFP